MKSDLNTAKTPLLSHELGSPLEAEDSHPSNASKIVNPITLHSSVNTTPIEQKVRTPLALKASNDTLRASESQPEPTEIPFDRLIDLPREISSFSLKAQTFLNNTGITIQDLTDAKISQEIFEQLLNASFTKRFLRWLALESLLKKNFHFHY